jgi:hypothetical protein
MRVLAKKNIPKTNKKKSQTCYPPSQLAFCFFFNTNQELFIFTFIFTTKEKPTLAESPISPPHKQTQNWHTVHSSRKNSSTSHHSNLNK